MNRATLKIVIISTLATILIGGYYLYDYFKPIKIVSVSISENAINVPADTKSVKIVFDRDNAQNLIQPDLKISLDAPTPLTLPAFEKPNTLIVSFDGNLEPSTFYTLTLQSKKLRKPFVLNFSTETKEIFTDRTLWKGDPTAYLAFDDYEKRFPLLKFFPYKTKSYSISQRGQDDYVVRVFDKETDLEVIKKEVYKWFTSNGVDPTKVAIEIW